MNSVETHVDPPAARHRDDGRTVYDFTDLFFVECPRCGRCARSVAGGPRLGVAAKLVCAACLLTKRGPTRRSRHPASATDWWFGLPLFLRTPCRGEELWAYNGEHLKAVRAIVAAELRERPVGGRSPNNTLASRLPKWALAAKARDDVLAGLDRLRAMLPPNAAGE